MAGIKIPFLADVSGFVRSTDKMSAALDDVSDDLAKLGRDDSAEGLERDLKGAGKAADKLGDEAKKAGRDTERALDAAGDEAKSMERKVKDAFQGIDRDSKKVSQSMPKDMEKASRETGESIKTIGDEARSNLSETVSSFRGDAEDLGQIVQDIAGGVVADLGPAGMIAGTAMAAGIGIAIAQLQAGAEANDEMRDKAIAMAGAIVEAGGKIEDVDIGAIISEWGRQTIDDNWVTFWTNEASTKFQETAKWAREAGVDIKAALKAGGGSAQDSERFIKATERAWAELNQRVDEANALQGKGTAEQNAASAAAIKQRDALQQLRKQAQDNIDTSKNAVEIAGLESAALEGTEEAAQRAADAIKEKADATKESAGAAMDLTTAENEYVTTLAQMTKDIAANGKSMDINTEAGRANRESLVDLAQSAISVRDAQIKAGTATETVTSTVQKAREAFIQQAEAAGLSESAAGKLADTYGLIPKDVKTLVKAEGTEEAKAKIDSIPEEKDAKVKTTEEGSDAAQAKVDAVHGKDVKVTTGEQGTAGQTQAAIDAIQGKDVRVGVTEQGTARMTQVTIDRINGHDVRVGATEQGTARQTQETIDRIHGKDVDIRVNVANYWEIQRTLDILTAPRSVSVTVNEVPGRRVDH